MNLRERLLQAVEDPAVDFGVFLSSFRPNGKILHIFLEGKADLAFYGLHVRKYMPEGCAITFVRCGPKKKVLERAYDYASRFGNNPRAIFIIDRDFDELLGSSSHELPVIYTTAGYSVENYICDPLVIARYCNDALGLDSEKTEFVLEWFRSVNRSFDTIALRLMIWMLSARLNGFAPNLSNISNRDLFQISADGLTIEHRLSPRAEVAYLHGCTGIHSPLPAVNDTCTAIAKMLLQNASFLRRTRGKQILWLLVAFLQYLQQSLEDIGHKSITSIRIVESNAVEVLAVRADTPPCLANFVINAFNRITG